MSQAHTTPASSFNFQLLFNNALKAYEKHTKKDLLAHPLAVQLQSCDSPTAILAVLQQQAQELNQSRNSNEGLTNWLDPTINILLALSGSLGEGVGLVFSPAKVIFAGVGVLLSAAKDVRASQDTLIEIFERIENFFRRLETYTAVPPTPGMMDIIAKIMVEVLCILAIATKEIKQGRTKKYMKKLIGRTDLEDALKRLDKLTHEEARMAIAQVLKATQTVDDRVRAVDDKVAEMMDDEKELKADVDQMQQKQSWDSLHKWLSPPDPSTNHNIACRTHHKRAATWFFQGSIFGEWKMTGSLLWIHGKPGSGKSILCSTIIQDIEAMCEAGQASMSYFYFDFRNVNKQNLNDLVCSLLTQLSARSDPRCDIVSRLYEAYDRGTKQPSDDLLTQCLKRMLTLPNQGSIYLIMDALDECPNSSGIPTPRERVLLFVKELVELSLPNLHICVTSRPEIDIRDVMDPLTSHRVSLHDQSGQKKDIVDYVRSIVYSDSEPIMKRWRTEDKELVIETLSERANGMFRWVFCQLDTLRHCLPSSVRRTLNELPESLDETYERVLREIKKPNRDHALRLLQCLVVATRPLRVEELAEVLAVDFDGGAEGTPKLKANWRWEDQEQALLSSCSSLITIIDNADDHDDSGHDMHDFGDDEQVFEDYENDSKDDGSEGNGNDNGHDDSEHDKHDFRHEEQVFEDYENDYEDHENDSEDDGSEGNDNDNNHSRIVQFSHFSVKEFLTSPRLATPSRDVSYYHIDLEPAHTIMAHACLSVLLWSDDSLEDLRSVGNNSPLVGYAAQNWVAHSQFQNVLSHVQAAMERLFDPDKPYFSAWVQSYDIDVYFRDPSFSVFRQLEAPESDAAPLYYAALCGFQYLVEYLMIKHPQQVTAHGGHYLTPALAALAGRHFEIAQLLYRNGSSVDLPDLRGHTPLLSAAYHGDLEMVQVLLEYKANVNSRTEYGSSPLLAASLKTHPQTVNIVQLLLGNGANSNAPCTDGETPLHAAISGHGNPEVVRLLLEYGAEVQAKYYGKTVSQVASELERHEATKLLSDHGAKGI